MDNDAKYLKRKVKAGPLDVHPTEKALVVNYELVREENNNFLSQYSGDLNYKLVWCCIFRPVCGCYVLQMLIKVFFFACLGHF